MRGNYFTTNEDRRRFFHRLSQLCDKPTEWCDLVSTQLSMYNCVDLLEELGYECSYRRVAHEPYFFNSLYHNEYTICW